MAKQRLKWLDCYQAHGENASLTCRYFGISRQTFYRWKRRFNPRGTLQPWKSVPIGPAKCANPPGVPNCLRRCWSCGSSIPGGGRTSWQCCCAGRTGKCPPLWVGRILTSLKIRGVLREPPANGISARKRHRPRPYAVRKPKEYQAREPGDIVQVDTLDVRPLPGVVLKHFTARDVVSRWDVLEVHTRATATTAKAFLDTLQDRLPFPLNPNPPKDRDGRREDSGRGEGVTGAMIRARIWVDGRLAGGLQALLGAPMAAYSGCGEGDGGIGHGKRRWRTGVARDCGDVGLAGGSVADGRRQAGSGMARSRARARLNCSSQGQRRGRCRVNRRAERVIRPAKGKTRRLRVLVVTIC